jgi:hypothetical protein
MCVVREHKGHKLSDIDETATMRENALAVVLSPRIAGAEKNSNDMWKLFASWSSFFSFRISEPSFFDWVKS